MVFHVPANIQKTKNSLLSLWKTSGGLMTAHIWQSGVFFRSTEKKSKIVPRKMYDSFLVKFIENHEFIVLFRIQFLPTWWMHLNSHPTPVNGVVNSKKTAEKDALSRCVTELCYFCPNIHIESIELAVFVSLSPLSPSFSHTMNCGCRGDGHFILWIAQQPTAHVMSGLTLAFSLYLPVSPHLPASLRPTQTFWAQNRWKILTTHSIRARDEKKNTFKLDCWIKQ